MPQAPGYEQFLQTCAELIGTENVLSQSDAEARFGACTTGVQRTIPGALRPGSREDVAAVVQASRDSEVPLYPISSGNNWGYGSANPALDGCVIVDLSRMNRIVSIDARNGVAVLEPGVTQQQLRAYLDANNLRFLCPVTGAGPSCSLVGNALERGYGITPHADHFLSIMSLQAVLPDGRLYSPPLAAAGCDDADKAFKWGIGPFLDGLFSQGAFGIVTQMTIALAPIPERVEAFFFGVEREEDLGEAVVAVQSTLKELGGVLGSINLMNARRVLSMMGPYPADHLDENGIVDAQHLAELAKRSQVKSWMGAGAMYGNAHVVRAAKKVIRQKLKGTASRLMFFTPESVARFAAASHWVPFDFGRSLQNLFGTLSKSLQLLAGAPSEIALPLAYWVAGKPPLEAAAMNPAHDGCGLIWYAPLVPMNPETVIAYKQMVTRVCAAHGIEPLITLTSVSDRCFDSTVPLLFDPAVAGQQDRANRCFAALLDEGRKLGCTPYRAPIADMGRFIQLDAPYWQVVGLLKQALDPLNLISPGRYAPKTLGPANEAGAAP